MDSFHIWHKWSLAWEGVSHVMTFALDLYRQGHSTLFWFGTQHDSIVWVIMRRRGYPQNAGVLVVLVNIWRRRKRNSHPIWNTMEKSFVKWVHICVCDLLPLNHLTNYITLEWQIVLPRELPSSYGARIVLSWINESCQINYVMYAVQKHRYGKRSKLPHSVSAPWFILCMGSVN